MSEIPEADAFAYVDEVDREHAGNETSPEPTAPTDEPSDNETERGALGFLPAWATSERLALWVFIVFVVAAVPLILFHYGSYHWFLRDEFGFLADRKGTLPPVFEPNGGVHWVLVPRLVYFALWQLFGMTTYLPYQACAVALHLTCVVLLRVVMRRNGVGPWLATAAASILVLFGPGSQNIVWAFQIAFTGAIAFGLVQLLLADHDGPIDRRDVLGLAAGALAIMSSGVGLTMVVVVGLSVLLRRGWRAAAFHTAPLAVLFGAWALSEHITTGGPFGRPTPDVLLSWVRNSLTGTFLGLGHFTVVAVVFGVTVLVGTVLVAVGKSPKEMLRHLAMPVSLFLGGIAFAANTGMGRWWSGIDGARAGRYVYIIAALSLPLLAVAAQEIVRRTPVPAVAFVAVFLLVIPFNLASFRPLVFGKAYMDQRRYVLTTAVRMPFAKRVPPQVQPIPDAYSSEAVTMGFLLTARRNGDLDPSTKPIGPLTTNEFRVRLGVFQHRGIGTPTGCRVHTSAVSLAPAKGETIVFRGPIQISTARGKRSSGPQVSFNPSNSGDRLTFELSSLHLLISRANGASSFELCTV